MPVNRHRNPTHRPKPKSEDSRGSVRRVIHFAFPKKAAGAATMAMSLAILIHVRVW
jgi:hypothetical protein